MEQCPSALIRSDRLFVIDFVRSPEQWPAKFHPTLDDPSTFANDPVEDQLYVEFRCAGRRVFQHDKVKWHADLRVGCLRETIERVQVKQVVRRERWISFQAFQEHSCMFTN